MPDAHDMPDRPVEWWTDLAHTGGVVCPFCGCDRLIDIAAALLQCPACMFGRVADGSLALRGGSAAPPFHGVNPTRRPDLWGFAATPSFTAMQVSEVTFLPNGYAINGVLWSSPPANALLSVSDIDDGMVTHTDPDTAALLSAWWVRTFDLEYHLGETVITPTGRTGRLYGGSWSQGHHVRVNAPTMIELPVLQAGCAAYPLPFVHGLNNRSVYTDANRIPGMCLTRHARDVLTHAARRRWDICMTRLDIDEVHGKHRPPANRSMGWKQIHPDDLLLDADYVREIPAAARRDMTLCSIHATIRPDIFTLPSYLP